MDWVCKNWAKFGNKRCWLCCGCSFTSTFQACHKLSKFHNQYLFTILGCNEYLVCNIDKKACNRTAFYHQLQITYAIESEDQMSHSWSELSKSFTVRQRTIFNNPRNHVDFVLQFSWVVDTISKSAFKNRNQNLKQYGGQIASSSPSESPYLRQGCFIEILEYA